LEPYLADFGFINIRTVLPLGGFLPVLRAIRVRPGINRLLERNETLRSLNNKIGVHGRPVFKNPVVLICDAL
jgi:hypothetical protein